MSVQYEVSPSLSCMIKMCFYVHYVWQDLCIHQFVRLSICHFVPLCLLAIQLKRLLIDFYKILGTGRQQTRTEFMLEVMMNAFWI